MSCGMKRSMNIIGKETVDGLKRTADSGKKPIVKGAEKILRRGSFLIFILVILMLAACDHSETRVTQKQFAITAQDVTFSVGDDCDSVLEALGEPNRCSSAPSCAGEGEDELYVYNGFLITAHRAYGKAEVTSVELTNDTVSTCEGVSIGDSSERLTDIYGEGEHFSGGVEYVGKNCRLRFYIKEGKIAGIRYSG